MFTRVPSVESWRAGRRLGWQGWALLLLAVLAAGLVTAGAFLFAVAGAWSGDMITLVLSLSAPFLIAGGSALGARRASGNVAEFLRAEAWLLFAGGVLLMIPVVLSLVAWATGH